MITQAILLERFSRNCVPIFIQVIGNNPENFVSI